MIGLDEWTYYSSSTFLYKESPPVRLSDILTLLCIKVISSQNLCCACFDETNVRHKSSRVFLSKYPTYSSIPRWPYFRRAPFRTTFHEETIYFSAAGSPRCISMKAPVIIIETFLTRTTSGPFDDICTGGRTPHAQPSHDPIWIIWITWHDSNSVPRIIPPRWTRQNYLIACLTILFLGQWRAIVKRTDIVRKRVISLAENF